MWNFLLESFRILHKPFYCCKPEVCLLHACSGLFRIFQDVLAYILPIDAPVAMRHPWRCSLIFPSRKNRAVGVQNIRKISKPFECNPALNNPPTRSKGSRCKNAKTQDYHRLYGLKNILLIAVSLFPSHHTPVQRSSRPRRYD